MLTYHEGSILEIMQNGLCQQQRHQTDVGYWGILVSSYELRPRSPYVLYLIEPCMR